MVQKQTHFLLIIISIFDLIEKIHLIIICISPKFNFPIKNSKYGAQIFLKKSQIQIYYIPLHIKL